MATYLVERLPEELPRVLAVLWSCLSDMKDDLSSSVGAVMDLLGTLYNVLKAKSSDQPVEGQLVAYNQVIQIIADETQS